MPEVLYGLFTYPLRSSSWILLNTYVPILGFCAAGRQPSYLSPGISVLTAIKLERHSLVIIVSPVVVFDALISLNSVLKIQKSLNN